MQDLKLSNNTSKLHQMFGPKLYSDKFSFISEVCQNAVDSHRMAGQKEYVTVGLKQVDRFNHMFYVQDRGLSFTDEEDFISKVCTLLESGKSSEKTNDESCAMGEHGIGSISVSAFVQEWNYEVVTPTKELFYCKFRWIEGRGLTYDLSKKRTTDLEKGVKVFLQFPSSQLSQVYLAMTSKLCYFKDIYFEFDNSVKSTIRQSITLNTDFKLFQSDDFQISTLSPFKELHITLDQYSYKIDWSRLGISVIPYNIALKFGMGDGLKADITRENLQYVDNYKTIILEKLRKVSEWIVSKYNDSFPDKITDFKESQEVFNRLNLLTIETLPLNVSVFENHSKVKSKGFKYKDVDLNTYIRFNKQLEASLRPAFLISNGKRFITGYMRSFDDMYYLDSPLTSIQRAFIASLKKKSIFCEKRKYNLKELKRVYSFGILNSTVKAHYRKTGINLLRVFVNDLNILQEDYVNSLMQASKIEVPKDFVPPPKKPRSKSSKETLVAWKLGRWNTKHRKEIKICDIESAAKPLIYVKESEIGYCRKLFDCSLNFDLYYVTDAEIKRRIEKLKIKNVMTLEEFKANSPEFTKFINQLHCSKLFNSLGWLRHYKCTEVLTYVKHPLIKNIKADFDKILSLNPTMVTPHEPLVNETLPLVSSEVKELFERIRLVTPLIELLIPLTTISDGLKQYKVLAFEAIADKMSEKLSKLYDTSGVLEVGG